LSIEHIVYLLRKTSLNLQDIGRLTPRQFNELLKELYFQEAQDEYRKQHSTASLLAAIYNTIPRKAGHVPLQAKDFLSGDMPTRDGKHKSPVDDLAKRKGIKVPSR
jgi:hypothetical protein